MQRLVLLGASNLTVGFPLLFGSLQTGVEGPAEVFAALGHGRSYGAWSRVFFRELPGIVDCGLWDELESRPEPTAGTRALITDVGNDLAYGAPVSQIADWVGLCLERLAHRGAQTVLTLPPMASLRTLSAWRYRLMRTVLFPHCRIEWLEMLRRAEQLSDRLGELARSSGALVVEPEGRWYGFDPIHIRRGHRTPAWSAILTGWPGFEAARPVGGAARRNGLRLGPCRPAHRRLFGRPQQTPQPVLNRGAVSLFLY